MTFLQFDLPKEQSSIIKVFGVGGGGSNAVNHMHELGIIGVNFVVCNTDAQALDMSRVPNKIQLGPESTQGLGAGANPEVGMTATEESMVEIKDILSKNTKMVFITAGMGGGTGTGGAPVVARIAREMGILTVGIVTTPFSFEGKKKYQHAMDGINKLKDNVDTILIICNDKIRQMYGNMTRTEAFNQANNILATAAKSISEIITKPGEVNVDFADVVTVMKKGGAAMMGSASAEGENRAMRAVEGAINSPLLNDNDIRGAKQILINITTGTKQATIDEISEINEYVQEIAKDTNIIFGACDDEAVGEKLCVTIIATGFEANNSIEYSAVTKMKVYDLEKKAEPTVTQTQTETNTATVVIQDEPTLKEPKSIGIIDDRTPNLFDTSFIEKSEPVKEANYFEFEVTTAEQKIELPLEEEATLEVKNEIAPAVEEKKEEEYQMYSVQSVSLEKTPVAGSQLKNELEDRKKVLTSMSYRFGNKGSMTELENTPAYLRKGMEVNAEVKHSESSDQSRYSVQKNEADTNTAGIRNSNSFLHDQPD